MDLRRAIFEIANGPTDARAEIFLVEACHRLARAYLNHKVRLGTLSPESFGLTIEDLALDCIADLFERDAHGRYIHLNSYLGGISWQSLDEPGLQMALRRLVFSKVNDGLFRRYREHDPCLGKIIRNLKLAIGPDSRFMLVRSKGDTLVTLTPTDASRASLPDIPPEILEGFMIPELGARRNMRDVLEAFHGVLVQQRYYSDSLPLGVLARVIRSSFAFLHESENAASGDALFRKEELEIVVGETLAEVSRGAYPRYVLRNKVSPPIFALYFRVIRQVILENYAGGEATSYYAVLQEYLPKMTRAEYATRHRNVIEYLGKQVKKRVIEGFSEWLKHAEDV